MSLDTFHQSSKIEDLIAATQATNLGPTVKSIQVIENSSAPKADDKGLALSTMNTSDLVKTGYERLRAGDAKSQFQSSAKLFDAIATIQLADVIWDTL